MLPQLLRGFKYGFYQLKKAGITTGAAQVDEEGAQEVRFPEQPEIIGLVRKLPDLAEQRGPHLLLPTLPHPPPRTPTPL